MDKLPSEIVRDIIIRLPVTSILQCRSVCKSWNSLIAQSSFADYHRSVSPLALLVLDFRRFEGTRFGILELNSSTNGGVALNFTERAIDYPPAMSVWLVGSYNGLVCLADMYYSYGVSILGVWNPMLGRRCLEIPVAPSSLGDDPDALAMYPYTFGYVPSTREYKVVKVAHISLEKGLTFYVCTLGNGGAPSAWMRINFKEGVDIGQPTIQSLYEYYNSTSVNGLMVWIVGLTEEESRSFFLMYFDLENEETGTHWLPPTMWQDKKVEYDYFPNDFVGMGVYYDDEGNGILYLCDECESFVNIWVMEDCKSIDSLKFMWVIQLPHDERVPLRVLKLLKDGRLVISYGLLKPKVAYYDPKTGVIEGIDHPEFPRGSQLFADRPSFLGCMMKHEN